jgi:hypothetical protein
MVAIALELQHGVDDVFEHARAGEPTFLGDVADEHDRRAALLGLVDEALSAAADLADAARERSERRIGDGLDRVDHDHLGADLLDRIEHVGQ